LSKEDFVGAYFDDKDLAHFGDLKGHHPDLWTAFESYYGKALEPGLLTKREKVLVGFAVAASSQCPYCIDSYTQQALEQGLTMKHLAEALHAAASLKAGITLAHGLVAHNIDKKVSM
jgi:alkylhydroperoxidase/carboxymuconolactone decarboxylase family protein